MTDNQNKMLSYRVQVR